MNHGNTEENESTDVAFAVFVFSAVFRVFVIAFAFALS
jgi:hypothetical protein